MPEWKKHKADMSIAFSKGWLQKLSENRKKACAGMFMNKTGYKIQYGYNKHYLRTFLVYMEKVVKEASTSKHY